MTVACLIRPLLQRVLSHCVQLALLVQDSLFYFMVAGLREFSSIFVLSVWVCSFDSELPLA